MKNDKLRFLALYSPKPYFGYLHQGCAQWVGGFLCELVDVISWQFDN
jgi:hypothetical protein